MKNKRFKLILIKIIILFITFTNSFVFAKNRERIRAVITTEERTEENEASNTRKATLILTLSDDFDFSNQNLSIYCEKIQSTRKDSTSDTLTKAGLIINSYGPYRPSDCNQNNRDNYQNDPNVTEGYFNSGNNHNSGLKVGVRGDSTTPIDSSLKNPKSGSSDIENYLKSGSGNIFQINYRNDFSQ